MINSIADFEEELDTQLEISGFEELDYINTEEDSYEVYFPDYISMTVYVLNDLVGEVKALIKSSVYNLEIVASNPTGTGRTQMRIVTRG